MSRKNRVDHLENVLPEDVSAALCLDRLDFWRGEAAARRTLWSPYLDLDDPPAALPVVPFGGVCPKSPDEPVCADCLVIAQQHWARHRDLAVGFQGIPEHDE